MSESIPAAHEGERGNTVDAVADLLLQEEPTVEVEEEKAAHRPNDDDLIDDSEGLEVEAAQESDDVYEDETDDSNEQETDDNDDNLAALAEELGLDADKLTLSEDGEKILVNLKVNGKDQKIDLKEAISQTQFSKANDEKARNIAQERKAFESERNQVAQQYSQQLQQIRGLGEMLEKKLMQDFNGIDFDHLRITDPAEWVAKQHEFSQRQQELQQAGQMLGQQMRIEQDRESEQETQFRQQTLQAERARMIENNPSWQDEEVMKGDLSKIVDYARSNGFEDDELSDVIYSRHVEMLRKAMLFDAGQTVASKKVKQVPNVQRPRDGQGRFAKGGKNGKVNKLIERAQSAKGANKREAQADAVAALLMGE